MEHPAISIRIICPIDVSSETLRSPALTEITNFLNMKSKNDKESVSQKSAAEFFSEHQQIAGFDNPGKSLFTTIREFVENSLDG